MNSKIVLIRLFFLMAIISIGCKQKSKISSEKKVDNSKVSQKTSIKKDRMLFNKKENNKSNQEVFLYRLNDSIQIKVEGANLLVVNHKKNIIQNKNIIREKDQNRNCISDGFNKIVTKDIYFTIEQQNCSNKYLINEFITFKIDKDRDNIILHALGYSYIDKSDPDRIVKDKTFNKNNFGKIPLKDVKVDSLYIAMINN